jgi:hypothetical protein
VDIAHAVTISGAGARSTVIEASGESGGMFDDAGLSGVSVTIEDVTLAGGSTDGSGGALDLESGVTFDVTGDTLTNDIAAQSGGAIEVANETPVNITDSTIGPGDTAITNGGGLDNSGGTVSLTDSTVSGDSASNGGGISSAGQVSQAADTTLDSTTVAYNSASADGGDVYSNNSNNTPPAIEAGDSIIADGSAPSGGDCNDNSGGFTSDGYNVTDGVDSDGAFACGVSAGLDGLGDVRLGPLQNNGGQTDMIALAAGSPAIGLVSGADNGCSGTDQRGEPRGGGAACDAGALESGNAENAPQWSVAHDFATSPQANPSPDSLGNAGVWSYLQVPWTTEEPPPAPSADTLLPGHGANSCGEFAWTGASGLPSVAFNASAATATCGTAAGPMHSVVMEPSAGDYAIVAWKSPVTGTIAIAGSFESMDASGGDGSNWYVQNGSTTIASGANVVGGSGAFDPAPLAVTQGQTLYFILGPSSSGDATADSTELSLTITAAPGACLPSITLDAVQVLADCVSPAGDGTFLATGHARFADGAEIVEPGTQTPATLVLNPSSHTISVSGGGGGGELESGGVPVGGGTPVVDARSIADPVSGIAGSAAVGGIDALALDLSGWTFANAPVTPTVYLLPSGAGGGAAADGRLTLPAWLGGTLRFGPLEPGGYPSGVTGQLAVQATAGGQVRVLNGGVSFKSTSLGTAGLGLAGGELSYQAAGSDWTGTAALTFAKLAGLPVDVTVANGKLVSVSAAFACGSQAACTGAGLPTLGPMDVEDADAQLLGLSAVDYTPGQNAARSSVRLSGGLIGQLLSDRAIAGGSFSYGLSVPFTANGTAGFEPLYGGSFASPAALGSGQSAGAVVASLLGRGAAGIELTKATISYPTAGALRISGTEQVPPPRFPYRFLGGRLTITVKPPHFGGSGSMSMRVPGVIPVIGGLRFPAARAQIGDVSASGLAVTRRYCARGLGCSSGLAVNVTFKYRYGGFYWKLDGDGPGALRTHTSRGRRGARVGRRERFVSFAIRGASGSPRVELIGPAGPGGRRRLDLSSSGGPRNTSGALAWINSAGRTENFLVQLPRAGVWTIKRLGGPRIASVAVTTPR